MHFRELNLWGKSVFCIWWNCGGEIKTKGKMRTGAVSWRAWLLIVLFYGRCYFLNTTWNKCSFMDSPPKYDSSWSEKKVKLFIVSKSVAWGYFAQMNVQSSMVSLEHSITLLRTPRSKITCTHTIVQPERLQSTKYNWMPSQALTAWRPLHDPSAVLINLSRYATYPWVMDWRVLAPHWNEAS